MLGRHSIRVLLLAGFGVTGALLVLCSGAIGGGPGSADPSSRAVSFADGALQSKVDALHRQLADHSHELEQVTKELDQRTLELQLTQNKVSRLTQEMAALRKRP